MKKTTVTVPWQQGLHVRPATQLVKLARKHRSTIRIKGRELVADATSILSVLLLCATMGTMLEIEVSGEDELEAASAIEQLFGVDDIMRGPQQERLLKENDDETGLRS